MIPPVAIQAPRSFSKVRSGLFYLGAYCYLRSKKTRKIFDGASNAFGQIALAVRPGYRLGEIRQAIHRQIGFKELKPKAIASDLDFNQLLEQKGISEEMRHSLAWEFITQNISDEKTTFFFAKNAMAGILAAFAWVSSPLFLIGAGFFAARSVSDWIRGNKLRDAGFRYLISNPLSEIKFMLDYRYFKEGWPDKHNARFMKHLARFDANLAAYLDGERIGN